MHARNELPIEKDARGFTLIELLVVIVILAILAGLTLAVFNTTAGGDRIRGGARQLQSAVLGARDRAAQARAPRGVRLVVDPNDVTVVNSIIFIDAGSLATDGSVRVGRRDDGGPPAIGTSLFPSSFGTTADGDADGNEATPGSGYYLNVVRGYNTGWRTLYNQGLLVSGSRIRIPRNGPTYTVYIPPPLSSPPYCVSNTNYSSGPEVIFLTTAYEGSTTIPAAASTPAWSYGADGAPGVKNADDDSSGKWDGNGEPGYYELGWPGSDDVTDVNATMGLDYELQLAPGPTPGEQPLQFPRGVVIDLDNSDVPVGWLTGNTNATTPYSTSNPKYYPNMDIVFSPRGSVSGALGAKGLLHLLLAETKDTDQDLPPESSRGEKILVTVFTRTGAVSTHPVDVSSSLGPDGAAGKIGTDDDGKNGTDVDKDGIPDQGELFYPGTDDDKSKRYRFATQGSVAGK